MRTARWPEQLENGCCEWVCESRGKKENDHLPFLPRNEGAVQVAHAELHRNTDAIYQPSIRT